MRILPIALLLTIVIGCTVLKTDPEKKVRDFITEFQSKVENDPTGDGILALFQSEQSRESIMSAIHVLRNVEHPAVGCITKFDQASILNDSLGLRAFIPVIFNADTLSVQANTETGFTIWLKPTKDSYVISQLDGEKFYYEFLDIENQVDWVLEEREVLDMHLGYFRVKARLKEKFDTVVWVTSYGGKDLYYVGNAAFSLDSDVGSMGIVDTLGNEIIGLDRAYSLIGNPGAIAPDLVEVYQHGSVGLVNIETGKEIVPAEYTWIMPYEDGKVYALAMQDTIGWLNHKYEFKPGFPSDEAKNFYYTLAFIPEQIELSSNTQNLLEMPDEQNFGVGTFITPAYLAATGVFEPRYSDFSMDGSSYRAGTGSVQGSRSFFGAVTEKLDAILTTISTNYLEGREEFYSENKLNFINHTGEIVASTQVSSRDFSIKQIDSSTFEIRTVFEESGEYWPEDGSEINVPKYTYFTIDDDGVQELSPSRTFTFTEFVKIDESYITGSFNYYDSELGSINQRDQLSPATLMNMRNEILAEYGLIFDDQPTLNFLAGRDTYKPRYDSYDEVFGYMNEIDQHNVQFLEKIMSVSGDVSKM